MTTDASLEVEGCDVAAEIARVRNTGPDAKKGRDTYVEIKVAETAPIGSVPSPVLAPIVHVLGGLLAARRALNLDGVQAARARGLTRRDDWEARMYVEAAIQLQSQAGTS